MSFKHTAIIILVMFFLGSAYPLGKFGLNASINPIMFGALRMVIVFLCLIPFCKIKMPQKKYYLPLLGFSICMGAGVNMFLYLSLEAASILAPITIGAQLSIPLAIILSSMFLNESISFKKWILIFTSFFGIVLIAFDPKISEEILATLLIFAMAFFYGLSQVFSRYLKELDVKFTNAFMSLVGFIILIIVSQLFEGNIFHQISNIETNGWLAVLYAGAIISIFGHMMMFYLYKFYPVGMVLPFYALFPVFGLILTFLIFGEIPTLIMVTGGVIVIVSVFMLQKIR
ncbi:DMT family transporter [Candidatus Pelagibacter sp.]|nr:DMT family transporter [Candidatus Pelagibacter sp.]